MPGIVREANRGPNTPSTVEFHSNGKMTIQFDLETPAGRLQGEQAHLVPEILAPTAFVR
jgi:hypothetical protein